MVYSINDVQSAVFNASFLPLVLGSGKSHSTSTSTTDTAALNNLLDPHFRARAYEFCGPNVNCSLIIINSYDELDTAINDYFHQVNDSSCNDQFSLSESAWNLISENPPTTLVDDYYQCTLTPWHAFLQAIGVSVGNMSAAMIPFFPILVSIAAIIGIKKATIYSADEVSDAMREWFQYFLMVRDGGGRKEDKALVKEIAAAKVNAFRVHPVEPLCTTDGAAPASTGEPLERRGSGTNTSGSGSSSPLQLCIVDTSIDMDLFNKALQDGRESLPFRSPTPTGGPC